MMKKEVGRKENKSGFVLRTFVVSAALLSTFTFLLSSAFAYTSPGRATAFVNDFAGIIPSAEKQSIEAKLFALEQATGAEVLVVTVSSFGDEVPETYAVKLFEDWGIGKEKEDNGLLILVEPNSRVVRMEVGYGLEGAVTDLQSGNIINKVMIPSFREGKYGKGIEDGVDAVMAVITNSPEAAQYSRPASSSVWDLFGDNVPVLFFFVVIIFNVFARVLGKTKSWWLGGVLGAGAGAIIGLFAGFLPIGIIAIILLTILGLIFDFIVSKNPPGSDGKSGGIWPIILGGGRGGSSGGFGGLGGGLSGGGGATGRW